MSSTNVVPVHSQVTPCLSCSTLNAELLQNSCNVELHAHSLHSMVVYSVLHAMNACTLHGDKVFHLYGILVANVEKVQKVHDEINDLLKQ